MKRVISALLVIVMLISMMPIQALAGKTEIAESASFVERSDGIWYWPLPSSAYASFSDWAACNGNNSCMFHPGNNHGGCVPSHTTSNGYGHNGIDVGVIGGTKVFATAGGTLYCTSTDWASRGITAVVEHPIGTDGNGTSWSYYSVYQHLSSVVTSLDQKKVNAGDIIAYTGATDGYGTGAPHLHFGILLSQSGKGYNMSRNPNNYISAVENSGWILTEGYASGRILNNPALNSPAGLPGGLAADNVKLHAGSVMYTFNSSEVQIGEVPLNPWIKESYRCYGRLEVVVGTANVKSLPCSKDTSPDSETLESPTMGVKYMTTGLVLNTVGNLWYEVVAKCNGQKGYLYAGDVEFTQYTDDIEKSNINAPTQLTLGDPFGLTGTIRAKHQSLYSVRAWVEDSNGNVVTGKTVEIKDSTCDISKKLDEYIVFNNDIKTPGTYIYKISVILQSVYAKTAKETAVKKSAVIDIFSQAFTVTSSGSGGSSTTTYTVKFAANGGTCATSSLTVTKGKAIGTLPTPSFENMDFVGWFTKPYGGTEVTASTVPTGDMEVFAHYVNWVYPMKLEFDPNGGTLPGPVFTEQTDGVNRGRPGESLVVFNKSGTQPGTNIYGNEIAVASNGKIVGTRRYGSETQLTVPDGGFILSGQTGWDDSAVVASSLVKSSIWARLM